MNPLSFGGNMRWCRLLAIACLLLFSCRSVLGQETAKSDPQSIKLFALENVAAQDAVQAIATLLNDLPIHISAQPEQNIVLVRGSADILQQVAAILEKLDQPQRKEPSEATTLRVYALRYMDASLAISVLSSMIQDNGASTRVSADKRLNQLVVSAKPEVHELIASVLKVLDVESSKNSFTPETTKILDGTEFPASNPAEAELYRRAAALEGVAIEVIEELNLIIVKGTTPAVTQFQATLGDLREQTSQLKSVKAKKAASTSYSVRIVWMFSTADAAPSTLKISDDLDGVRSRAEKYGIKNLTSQGQLFASARAEMGSPAKFTISGPVVVDGSRYTLEASGSLAAIDEEASAFALRVSLKAEEFRSSTQLGTTSGQSSSSNTISAEVDLQLAADKPVIIAAIPANDRQTIFVVEIVKDL